MGFKIKNKQGQVTIFIIIAIIIVAVVLLFLFLRSNKEPTGGDGFQENPSSFLSLCLKDSLIEGIELISKQGGYITPKYYKNFKFSDEQEATDISFLCYNRNYYFPCINQEPMLIQNVQKELSEYISGQAKNCFDSLGKSMEKEGYVVDARYNGFQLVFKEKTVEVLYEAQMVLTRTGETSLEKNFKVIVPSNIYGLVRLANEVIDQEAKYCNFDGLGYGLLYPQWKIDLFKTGDSVKIYTLENKESEEIFRFAVRGCVIPPGL